MTVYYNEIDPDAVAALRQLIAEDVIASGEVDNRSIKDVTANDLRGFTQCHFFAGGGLWSFAARLAGWPDTRPIWTGSCPCQPFSSAGARLGADDPRHLWPDFHRLIGTGRPPVVMGEQVAGRAGRHWFHGVRADLAGSGYAGRAVDFPACAVDAPHERNRLWWVAVANAEGIGGGAGLREAGSERHGAVVANRDGGDILLADTESELGWRDVAQRRSEGRALDGRADANGYLGHGDRARENFDAATSASRSATRQPNGRNGSWWADAEWIACHDGKARRAKPEIPMLVDGMVGRNGLWRLAGNSISPVAAAEVIAAYLDSERIAL